MSLFCSKRPLTFRRVDIRSCNICCLSPFYLVNSLNQLVSAWVYISVTKRALFIEWLHLGGICDTTKWQYSLYELLNMPKRGPYRENREIVTWYYTRLKELWWQTVQLTPEKIKVIATRVCFSPFYHPCNHENNSLKYPGR